MVLELPLPELLPRRVKLRRVEPSSDAVSINTHYVTVPVATEVAVAAPRELVSVTLTLIV
jgi:hypothetical protein